MLAITADTRDFTFDNVAIAFWSCVETNATVSVACIMTMKPILARWFPNLVEEPGQPDLMVARSGGRVLTIGSRPVRVMPSDGQRSLASQRRPSQEMTFDIKGD